MENLIMAILIKVAQAGAIEGEKSPTRSVWTYRVDGVVVNVDVKHADIMRLIAEAKDKKQAHQRVQVHLGQGRNHILTTCELDNGTSVFFVGLGNAFTTNPQNIKRLKEIFGG